MEQGPFDRPRSQFPSSFGLLSVLAPFKEPEEWLTSILPAEHIKDRTAGVVERAKAGDSSPPRAGGTWGGLGGD